MLTEINAVHNWLISSHKLNVPTDWLDACILWVKTEYHNECLSFEALCIYVFDQWLMSDLQDIGFSCLPPDILSADKLILNDIYCLQINAIFDVGVSLFTQQQKISGKENENVDVSAATQFTQNWNKGSKPSRMLMLKLTDGSVEISGMEFKPIPSLSLHIEPGTKILVCGSVTCRHGMLMLTSDNFLVLGGEVERLVEEKNNLLILQTHMQNNIDNCEKYRKQLPRRIFDSNIKSKFKPEFKTKLELNDFDDVDDDMLICADGVSAQNEFFKPLNYKNEISSCEGASSLKRPRYDSYNENMDIKLKINNTNTYAFNGIDYDNFSEDIELKTVNIQKIKRDDFHTNCPMPNDSNNFDISGNDFPFDDIDDNIDFVPTTSSAVNRHSNKRSNDFNNLYSTDEQFLINVTPPHHSAKKTNTTINTFNQFTNNSHNILTSDPDFTNDLDDSEFTVPNAFKLNPGAFSKPARNSSVKDVEADDIVNDIHSIIGTQAASFHQTHRSQVGTTYGSNVNVLSTQQGREFFDKCVDLFRDDPIEEASTINCANDTSNVNAASSFTCEYIPDDLIIDPTPPKINSDEPFTYISRILDNNSSGCFSVKAYVVTILGSLSHNFGAFWHLAVKINDGSRALDVDLSDDVIKNIVGMTAKECDAIKALAAKDLTVRANLMESLNKIKECLLNLSAILDVKFEDGCIPCITNIRPINSQDVQLLADRILILKS